MASSKRVSAIIPAYNVAPYIAEALASVFAQRFAPHEVVLVNDGSSDGEELEREIAPFGDRIIYIKQPNKGAAAARNTAVRAASGKDDPLSRWIRALLAHKHSNV